VPGAYDPKSHLYIYGTGNPTPAYIADARGNGNALFTCSLLAVNVDTGNLAWYYQTSPNDTHDWDSAQTPILADIALRGRKRKVVMTAARNGYFFVVDRDTGAPLITRKFSNAINWAQPRLNPKGQPVRLREKDGTLSGALVSNGNGGATNWQPSSYSPDYGLFYVQTAESWALLYKTESDAGGAYSMEGKEEVSLDVSYYLKAIEPSTGRIVWSVRYPSKGPRPNGILTTAGRLLFAGDTAGNLIARDSGNGRPLWHTRLGQVSNAPETYMLDGHQFVLVASGDSLYAFRLE
jgi:alcohol dehydrogenase (cytochrome c)